MRANLMEKIASRHAVFAACLICAALLGGCETTPSYWDASADWPTPTYFTVVVHRGDSVGRIAARYDIGETELARANDIAPNTRLEPGEVLHVPATRGSRSAVMQDATNERAAYAPPTRHDRQIASEDPAIAPRSITDRDRVTVRNEPAIAPHPRTHLSYVPHVAPAPRPVVAARVTLPTVESGERLSSSSSGGAFAAPVSGRIILAFGETGNGQRNDGINIAAPAGTPIRAAADGTVSYAGNELKGYGNLILIKHDGDYVTAYAHAASIGVARGQHVSKGDVIGTVGQTGDVDQPQLHFEVRQGMKPVDPQPLVMASAS